MSDELNKAIQLVEQKRDDEAQLILEGLIAANTQDLTAWSWYVKSCRTPEKRLEALELCLSFNPDNPQILAAIQKLREKPSAHPPAPRSVDAAPGALPSPKADSSPYAVTSIPAEETATMAGLHGGLDDTPGLPLAWYDVWRIAMFKPTVEGYTSLLQDPLAKPTRAYMWIFLTTLVAGLFGYLFVLLNSAQLFQSISAQPEMESMGTWMAIGLIFLIPLNAGFSVLGEMLLALIYGGLARLFGSTGDFSRTFSRTVYLLGASYAPYTLILSILALIPCVNILSIVLGFYIFYLSVRAVEVAHGLVTMRAAMVVLIPVLLGLMIYCLLWFAMFSMLSSLQIPAIWGGR